MKRIDLEAAAAERPPHIRYGQAVFNLAYAHWPAEVEPVRGTTYDPFFRDERVDMFIDLLTLRGCLQP